MESVKNRTVITAIDGDRIRENVFTNIDSAVINKGLTFREALVERLTQDGRDFMLRQCLLVFGLKVHQTKMTIGNNIANVNNT